MSAITNLMSPGGIRMQRYILAAWLAFIASSEAIHAQGPAPDKNGWYDLFDGKTLDSWKAAEEPKAFKERFGFEPVIDRQLDTAVAMLKGVRLFGDRGPMRASQ